MIKADRTHNPPLLQTPINTIWAVTREKPVLGNSYQVRHKQGCAAVQKMASGLKFRI